MSRGWYAIVIMGVAGCGKTTIGRLLAARTGARFCDGDDFHPAANRAKMARGQALTDEDRAPWLARLRRLLDEYVDGVDCAAAAQRDAQRDAGDALRLVLACSALKESYRAALGTDRDTVGLVWLRADRTVLAQRLAARRGHFFPEALLGSQLAALEAPREALMLDSSARPAALVAEILGTK